MVRVSSYCSKVIPTPFHTVQSTSISVRRERVSSLPSSLDFTVVESKMFTQSRNPIGNRTKTGRNVSKLRHIPYGVECKQSPNINNSSNSQVRSPLPDKEKAPKPAPLDFLFINRKGIPRNQVASTVLGQSSTGLIQGGLQTESSFFATN